HTRFSRDWSSDVCSSDLWVIALGPEGGEGGGQVVAVGTPEQVWEMKGSHTGAALAAYETALGPAALAVREKPAQYAVAPAPGREERKSVVQGSSAACVGS